MCEDKNHEEVSDCCGAEIISRLVGDVWFDRCENCGINCFKESKGEENNEGE